MENNNPGQISHQFLADILDDLTPAEIVSMMNYFAVNGYKCSRANIKGFRKSHLNKKIVTV